MGCFLGCFGSSKDRKRRKQRPNKLQPRDHQRNTNYTPVQSTVSLVQKSPEKQIIAVSEVGVKGEEQLQSSSGARKKVTFDSNVRTYEQVLQEEVAGKEDEAAAKEEGLVKPGHSQSSSETSSITSSSGSYPPNHRYQNFRECDDEEDKLDYEEDSDLDDDNEEEDGVLDYEDGINGLKIDVDVAKEDDDGVKKPIRANGTARDRSGYVNSVLNPVENLTQWKALKTKGKPQLKQQKENFAVDEEEPRASSFSVEPSFKELSLTFRSKSDHHQTGKASQEIAVDASLSNWLLSSSSEATTPINKNNTISSNSSTPEKTTSQQGSNSPWSQEDRPILGALTLEEIKQFSASSSPRKSPSRSSPDDMPIIGTVGTYWTHTDNNAKDSGSAAASSSYKGIPNTTSKYREDKRVNWHSTPFETRLERALNRGAAEAFST